MLEGWNGVEKFIDNIKGIKVVIYYDTAEYDFI